jgi:hypothetical protein
MRSFAVALVHSPVVGRDGSPITTAITSVDVHDIARSARTFGASKYYVVHPVDQALGVVSHMKKHWVEGAGALRNAARSSALGLVHPVPTLEEARSDFGPDAEIWVTSARATGSRPLLSHDEARARLAMEGPPVLFAFGTGNGLAPSIMDSAAAQVAPILSSAPAPYNHLSVRAAVAILLDRIAGVSR